MGSEREGRPRDAARAADADGLGGLAEFERELIKSRTSEGRQRAKARGVHMGRPPALSPHQRRDALARREAGEALTDIARTFGVSHTTIGRLRADA
jgi:DNA invertase Pin-like site-specific DNA recombinase